VEHAIATCRYLGREPELTIELVQDAMENLFITESEEQNIYFTNLAAAQDTPSLPISGRRQISAACRRNTGILMSGNSIDIALLET